MGFMFNIFPVIFIIVFVFIFSMIIFAIVKGAKERNENNHSPRLTVDALVVSKRENVTHHQTALAGDQTGAHGFADHYQTDYYATFQVASGDRMELQVSGSEYGMLAEGDQGKLSFQGTRYLGFERSGV